MGEGGGGSRVPAAVVTSGVGLCPEELQEQGYPLHRYHPRQAPGYEYSKLTYQQRDSGSAIHCFRLQQIGFLKGLLPEVPLTGKQTQSLPPFPPGLWPRFPGLPARDRQPEIWGVPRDVPIRRRGSREGSSTLRRVAGFCHAKVLTGLPHISRTSVSTRIRSRGS